MRMPMALSSALQVDGVLESIRCGLENPAGGTYQKRMADVRLLGELYNYMLCNRWVACSTRWCFVVQVGVAAWSST